jgi:hypothetical protein
MFYFKKKECLREFVKKKVFAIVDIEELLDLSIDGCVRVSRTGSSILLLMDVTFLGLRMKRGTWQQKISGPTKKFIPSTPSSSKDHG